MASLESIDDILQPITENAQLENVLKLYREHLPESTIGFNFLKNHIKSVAHLKTDSNYQIPAIVNYKLYTKRDGNLSENGTIVALTSDQGNHVFFFTIEDCLTELTECLSNTNRINWKNGLFFGSVYDKYVGLMHKIVEMKNLKISAQTDCNYWCLQKYVALDFSYETPSDLEIKPLKIEDSMAINSLWPYRSSHSILYIKHLIKINGGLGVFKRHNNEIVSWILQNEYNGLGMLQTIDTEKRKGLAKLVLTAFCKQIASIDDDDLFTCIVQTNDKSMALFEKLGFSIVAKGCWMNLTNMNNN